jgi:hypothetical protein
MQWYLFNKFILTSHFQKNLKMMKQYLTTVVILALTLTACSNSRAPTTTTSATPSPNQTTRLNASNQCPPGIVVKVDGKVTPATAPNPFGGLENPSMGILKDRFSMGLLTEEAGLFELTDFDAKNLKAGTYGGEHFRLMLFNSPHSDGDCTNTNYQPDSKLTITEYNADSGNLAGCFYGKFDCGGKLIEVKAAVSGTIP